MPKREGVFAQPNQRDLVARGGDRDVSAVADISVLALRVRAGTRPPVSPVAAPPSAKTVKPSPTQPVATGQRPVPKPSRKPAPDFGF